MKTESKQFWTIDEIRDANRAAGFHWFDVDTMRFFASRICDGVFCGAGGVYFVSSEKRGFSDLRRVFKVRSFDPATGGVDTVKEFEPQASAKAAKRRAWKAAKGDGKWIEVVGGAFTPFSIDQQLQHDIARHGGKMTQSECKRLRWLARRHQRWMTRYCNGEVQLTAEGEYPKAVLSIRTQIRVLAKAAGIKGVEFGGDPRGETVKLVFADGASNNFGGTGWGVPT